MGGIRPPEISTKKKKNGRGGVLEKLRWLRREGYEWEGTHDWDDDYFGGRLF